MARVRRGTTAPITEGGLDEIAVIGPLDDIKARDAWRRDAAPEWRDLLDAQPYRPVPVE